MHQLSIPGTAIPDIHRAPAALAIPTAFQPGSPTSIAAAQRIAPRAGTGRARVLDFIESVGAAGATDEEMQRAIPMNANTQRPRRVELQQGHWIKDSGRTRPTLGGDQAVIWVLA